MKKCSKCGEIKSKSEFCKYNRSKDGCYSYCKECHRKKQLEYRKNNPEKIRKYRANQYALYPEKTRDWQLKRDYGISLEEYTKILEAQKGCCAICGTHQNCFSTSLAVDHCHTTGKVRALLCSKCNTGIGKFNEDIEILQKAISYLKEHNE